MCQIFYVSVRFRYNIFPIFYKTIVSNFLFLIIILIFRNNKVFCYLILGLITVLFSSVSYLFIIEIMKNYLREKNIFARLIKEMRRIFVMDLVTWNLKTSQQIGGKTKFEYFWYNWAKLPSALCDNTPFTKAFILN